MPTNRSVVITSGPGYTPIDAVRRITNHSTGRLGAVLANHFAAQGWRVRLLRGELATDATPIAEVVQVTCFNTLGECAAALEKISGTRDSIDAVLHAAALPDFNVSSLETIEGRPLPALDKLDSRAGEVVVRLAPAPKLIEQLRTWFPKSRLIGWKYEVNPLSETPEMIRPRLLEKAHAQLRQSHTDLCIVNGPAYGPGFGAANIQGWQNQSMTAEALAAWLEVFCSQPR